MDALRRLRDVGRRRPALEAGVVVLVLVVLAGAWYRSVWPTPSHFLKAVDHCPLLFCDFKLQFYPMGQTILQSKSPFAGFFYSPFFALYLHPYGSMEYATALRAWGVHQGLALAAMVLVPAIAFFRRSRGSTYLYLALCAFATPVLHNLKWGQLSVTLVALVVGAIYCERRGWRVAAAVLLALSASIKYYTGLFLLPFLGRRDATLLATFAGVLLVLAFGVPALLLGWSETVAFYERIGFTLQLRQARMSAGVNSQYVVNVVERWLEMRTGRWAVIDAEMSTLRMVLAGAGAILFTAHALFAHRVRRALGPDGTIWAGAILFLALPLVVPTSWPHYFVFLPLCQTLVARELGSVRGLPRALGILLLAASVFFSSVFCFAWIGLWRSYAYSGLLLVADLLLLAVVDALLLPRISAGRGGGRRIAMTPRP